MKNIIKILDSNDQFTLKQVEYDSNQTLKQILKKLDEKPHLYSHRLAIGDTVFLDWNLPIEICSLYGDLDEIFYLYKFRESKICNTQVLIKKLNEPLSISSHIRVHLTNKIRDLKNLINAYEGIPPDLQSLSFNNQLLDDENKNLAYYGIENNSEISLKILVKGGLSFVGRTFADVSSSGRFIKLSNDGPDWLLIGKGLNLFGKCVNKKCEAYENTVAIMIGVPEVFKLGLDSKPTNCPMCKKHVDPKYCGFYKCKFRFAGRKVTVDEININVLTEWKEIKEDFYIYDQNEEAVWIDLVIETAGLGYHGKRKTIESNCKICLSDQMDSDSSLVSSICLHKYHKHCFETVKYVHCEKCREYFKLNKKKEILYQYFDLYDKQILDLKTYLDKLNLKKTNKNKL